jgi:hypothetical protein
MQKTAFLFDIERKKCLERKRIEYLLEVCHGTSLNDSSKMRLIDLEKSSSVRYCFAPLIFCLVAEKIR